MAVPDDQASLEEKLHKLRMIQELGYQLYPYNYPVDTTILSIKDDYSDQPAPGEETDRIVSVAGRILSIRQMGRVIFADFKDTAGQIQLVLRENELTNKYELAKLLDSGDIIGVNGLIIRTKAGELSILAKDFELLNKSLTGIVDSYYGLKDIELRYRNRSLDLITNQNSFDTLKARYVLTQKIRDFMNSEGFLEVETPIVQAVYGGASAKPFKTFHEKLDLNMYLRVSPEQYLKRLLVGGFDAVYEMAKCFRNENIDRTHNPEFTMLEAYRSYKDYGYMMDLMERMYEYVLLHLYGKTSIKVEGRELNFTRPWPKLTINEALKTLADINIDILTDQEIFELVEKTDKQLPRKNRGEAVMILFEEHCEKKIIQPTHIIDFPKESTVFSKVHRKDPSLIERFESYIAGKEVSNGYSELNDPILQRSLLEEQAKLAENGVEEVWGQVDEEFLTAMDIGMPPAAGIGIGIDRMAMILLNQASIRDIIFFPTMKPVENLKQKK